MGTLVMAAGAVVDTVFALNRFRNFTTYGWDDISSAYEHLDSCCKPFDPTVLQGEHVSISGRIVQEPRLSRHGYLELAIEHAPSCIDWNGKLAGMHDHVLKDTGLIEGAYADIWGVLARNVQENNSILACMGIEERILKAFSHGDDDDLFLDVFVLAPREQGKEYATRIYYAGGIVNSEELTDYALPNAPLLQGREALRR